MKNPFIILLSLFVAFASFSCKKDETTPSTPLTATTISNIDASGVNGKYTFFSLKTGSVVSSSDSATANWDIAFRSTRIIFNSGTSGPGTAAISLQTGLFSDIKVVSDTMTFKTDNVSALALTASSGKGWYNYNTSTNIISPIAGKVLVVKTADGKYAKIEILSYYKDAPASPDATSTPRFYTFRYMYQTDGSKKLE